MRVQAIFFNFIFKFYTSSCLALSISHCDHVFICLTYSRKHFFLSVNLWPFCHVSHLQMRDITRWLANDVVVWVVFMSIFNFGFKLSSHLTLFLCPYVKLIAENNLNILFWHIHLWLCVWIQMQMQMLSWTSNVPSCAFSKDYLITKKYVMKENMLSWTYL